MNQKLDYRRGFKRLYAVASLIWILLVAIDAFSRTEMHGTGMGAYGRGYPVEDNIYMIAVVGLAPCIIGYGVLFGVLPWIARGFRSPKNSN